MLRLPACLVLLMFTAATVYSQELDFTQINTPYGTSTKAYLKSVEDDFLLLPGHQMISVDKGYSWHSVESQYSRLSTPQNSKLIRMPNGHMLITTSEGISRSSDNGFTWSQVVAGKEIWHMTQLANGDILYCLGHPTYKKDDSLVVTNDSFDSQIPLTNIPSEEGHLWIRALYTTQSGVTFLATHRNVYRSMDTGRTWQPALNIEKNGRYDYISTITEVNGALKIVSRDALGPNYTRINTSNDDGSTWVNDTVTSKDLGLTDTYKEVNSTAYLIGGGAYCYAPVGTNNWTVVEERILTILDNGDILKPDSLGIIRSTDDGLTWERSETGIRNYNLTNIAADQNDIMIWRSVLERPAAIPMFTSDLGSTWSYDTFLGVPMGDLIDRGITQVEFIDSLCYIGTENNGLYKINRISSTLSHVPVTSGWEVKEFQINNETHLPVVLTYDKLHIFYSGESLYRSYEAPNSNLAITNAGDIYRLTCPRNWKQEVYAYGTLGLSETFHSTFGKVLQCGKFLVNNSREWYVHDEWGIALFVFRDSGATVGRHTYSSAHPFIDRQNILYTGGGYGLIYWLDVHDHWIESGYKGVVTSAFVSQDNTIFLATRDDGILMTTPNVNATNAPPNANSIALSQNYPNPVTGSTTIPFSLGDASDVTLEVYNTLGRKVATLLQSHTASGAHSIPFDASGLTPGMYRYVLRSAEGMQSKWMTVVR